MSMPLYWHVGHGFFLWWKDWTPLLPPPLPPPSLCSRNVTVQMTEAPEWEIFQLSLHPSLPLSLFLFHTDRFHSHTHTLFPGPHADSALILATLELYSGCNKVLTQRFGCCGPKHALPNGIRKRETREMALREVSYMCVCFCVHTPITQAHCS